MAFPTPGPGTYRDIDKFWDRPRYKNFSPHHKGVVTVCFYKGGDSCDSCQTFLDQDYYKGRRKNLCLTCFKGLTEDEKRKERAVKARHCSFMHHHIGVPGITQHKTTPQQVTRLTRRERIMWIKYGDTL